MKRLRHLCIFGATIALMVCTLFAPSTFATSSVIRTNITRFDACPNIPGRQLTVPEGMVQDSNGNCYTPSVPPQPEIDLCRNLPGIQVIVPPGYFRTINGDCFLWSTEPVQPTDVCPNLPGIQTSVPEDYFIDPETGDCLSIDSVEVPDTAEDVCWNIPGIQTTTPRGMINDNGYCFTPPPATTDSDDDDDRLKNVPDFLQGFAQFFVNLTPGFIRDFFRDLPDEVVNATPVFVFVLILLVILVPLLQAIREYFYKRRLVAFYNREKSISEEKENFITLASHYLRTPIATMRDSATLMLSVGDIDQAKADSLSSALKTLGDQVSMGVEGISKNSVLQTVGVSTVTPPKPVWRSGWFWVPIIISIFLTILVNFFIGVVGDRYIGANNFFFQILVVVIFIVALYLVVRNYYINKKLQQEEKQLIAKEQAIDKARNDFIHEQTENINKAFGALYFSSPSLPAPRAYKIYSNGLSALSGVYGKFILLSQIRTGTDRKTTTFSLRSAIDRAVSSQKTAMETKKISIENTVGDVSVTQNQSLFVFVISALVDNAVKFANDGGRVVISSNPSNNTIVLKVSDNGRGIDPAKLDQLFKPFSRAESAVQFSYEGLGLSLFLSRLILNYVGGTIKATSRLNEGTDITITTPVDVSNLAPSK